jgi:hypothetical protein
MADIIPSDFDWVAARAKWSAVGAFETLRQRARSDTDRRNNQLTADKPQRFRYSEEQPPQQLFTVWDSQANSSTRRAVDIHLDSNSELRVSKVMEDEFALTPIPILNDAGECKFKVGDEELWPWQLLRRVLEPLFFDKGE